MELLSEDATAWVEENVDPNFSHHTLYLTAGKAEATLAQMREDGLI